MTSLIKALKSDIDDTITKLKKKNFPVDPIAGEAFSKITSVMSSSYKRHGFILERAILERLKTKPQFEVWEDRKFYVPKKADHIVVQALDDPTSLMTIEHAYKEKKGVRTLQVDAIVYDKKKRQISAYEIKRGNGTHDSGKRRSMLRDLLCVQILLKSYGEQKGYKISTARSLIIFYYGQCSLPKPFSLTKEELDKHFNYSVAKEVEKVNQHFRQRLYDLLTD